MIAWIAFAVLLVGVLWLAVLYEDWVAVHPEPDPDPLPPIKVWAIDYEHDAVRVRLPYDWEAKGDFDA